MNNKMSSPNLRRKSFARGMNEIQKQAQCIIACTGLVFLLSGVVAAFQSANRVFPIKFKRTWRTDIARIRAAVWPNLVN